MTIQLLYFDTLAMRSGVKTKFLLVGPIPPPETGQAVSFQMLSNQLVLCGYECWVVNIARKQNSVASKLSMRRGVEIVKAISRFLNGLLSGYRNVYITIAQSRAGFIRDFLLIWSAWFAMARIVVHLKGGNYDGFYSRQSRITQFLIRITLRRVERVLVLGESLREMYAFDPLIQSRVAVVPNGLPIDFEGKPKTHRKSVAVPLRVLFLSNLIQSKGYGDLLKALKRLNDNSDIEFTAVFAGRFLASVDDFVLMSPEVVEKKFLEEIREFGLSDRVRFVGPVSGSAKWNLLEMSDVFVLSTNYINEGQPVAIIEAMAYGCVVVTTSYRAIPDLVKHDETGLFVDYGSPEQIADAIRTLATHPEIFSRLSQAAVGRYSQHFTMDAHLRRIIPHLDGTAPLRTAYPSN